MDGCERREGDGKVEEEEEEEEEDEEDEEVVVVVVGVDEEVGYGGCAGRK